MAGIVWLVAADIGRVGRGGVGVGMLSAVGICNRMRTSLSSATRSVTTKGIVARTI